MRVEIYVEGPSDKRGMEALLQPLLETQLEAGIEIRFFSVKGNDSQRGGDAKKDVLTKIPTKAVNILRNQLDSIVIALPDLYPPNKGFPHETFEELVTGMQHQFQQVLQSKGINDSRLLNRFHVFCFKYDLEALILAAESANGALSRKLNLKHPLSITWTTPVEDQNHNRPPKKVIEEICQSCNQRYRETVYLPAILGSVAYQEIADRCPQCFQPLVEFLAELSVDSFS